MAVLSLPPEGPHLFPLEPHHAEALPIIDEAAHEAYDLWSDITETAPELIIRWPGECLQMSMVLQQRLGVRGLGTRLQEYRLGVGAHYFLQTDEWPGDELDLDSTWQQMLWQEHPDYNKLPFTLAVPALRLSPALAAHGIPDRWHCTWLQAKPSERRWQNVPSKNLHSLMMSLTVEQPV